MLNINDIRQNKSEFINRLKVKNFDASDLFDSVLSLDDKRKSLQKESDNLLEKSNKSFTLKC